MLRRDRLKARTTEVLLYRAGVIAQLGLSAHLLDVGFDDQWCAKYIRQDIAKALAYANASGLGWERAKMLRLAETLALLEMEPHRDLAPWTPQRWRLRTGGGDILLFALLDQVRAVTGHRVYRSDRSPS